MRNHTVVDQFCGEHVLRIAAGHLLDTPDLPPPPPGARCWRYVATLWPDPYQPGGWASLAWQPGPRGCVIPPTTAVGDVLEFGVCAADHHGHLVGVVRWYGWLDHATERALIVHGPYATPADADTAARPFVDDIRLAQLEPPDVETLTDSAHVRW